ncbi:GntR family transcriptional regulator [Demequina sp. NBRC 110054]|uniref:GntR family transcriptional regulator n=1 Tax=Demequina sp. NBRC 110054 TaxID=1570343 RepID=UPI000A071F55|nr:GntR family transcriptional regulator [Demequina sp. NBRC 110054]
MAARLAAPRDQDDVLGRLREAVADATVQGADRLPPERQLAERLGTSRARLRRAIDRLVDDGALTRVTGRNGGAFLTDLLAAEPLAPELFAPQPGKVVRDLDNPDGVPAMLAAQGFTSRTEVLAERLVPLPHDEIARRLGMRVGAEAVTLLRLRFADEAPLSLERMFVDPRRFPGLLDHSPIHSLYALLESEYATQVTTVTETVDVGDASQQVARHLGIRPRTPVLIIRRTAFDAAGAPVEASVDMFRADRTRLQVGTSDPCTRLQVGTSDPRTRKLPL